jgi:hypothetical protein
VAFSRLKRLFGRDKSTRRGQSEEYRRADPRDMTEEGGTVMSGPGGAPQEGLTPGQRRDLDRSTE